METTTIPSARTVFDVLVPIWPNAGSALAYRNCFELLVSVILSAQCTDEQVNKATPALFAAYPDARSLAGAGRADVEALVRTTGFYRAKAANIIATARMLVDEYDGSVPDTIEELTRLPGVGRKTANLIVSVCYGKPGIVVDTHVLRTARRLGLAPTDDPARSERMLGAALPESMWTAFSYALNRHGKHVCRARKPLCAFCQVASLCPSAEDFLSAACLK
ncbi:MAG: endonuclease III [Spirochaetae bacterium HGW-Spirochaetae-3]|jgi:endonuclease-3|nr:MAG: endonuclease III [Spirochaetae bacterium HGW-Spirochaetae-3]